MSHYRITSRYAKALLSLAIEKNELTEVNNDVNLIVDTCDDSRQLLLMFKNPIILPQKKLSIINQVFEGKLSAITSKFIEVTIRKNRSQLLFEVFEMFQVLYKAHNKIADAILYSAADVADKTKAEVKSMLEKAHGENVQLEVVVDESLIGGFMIRYKDQLLDASVSSQLNELKKEFLD